MAKTKIKRTRGGSAAVKTAPGPGLLQVLCRLLMLFSGCVLLGICTLELTVSNYDMAIFFNYFNTPMIPLTNILILFGCCCLLWLLTGREWIAFLLTWVIWLAIATGNYYLIQIRNDPLRFEDLSCLREALNITATQHYELNLTWRVWLPPVLCGAYTLFLGLLLRRLPRPSRWWLAAPAALFAAVALFLAMDEAVLTWTKNYDKIDSWSATQTSVSRGIVYTFSSSVFYSSITPPEDYSVNTVEAMLAKYPAADVPEDRRINLIAIMRESYSDLSVIPTTRPGAIDFSCYDLYHALQSESYTGTLITNGFGGNTRDAERCFLTGCTSAKDYRRPAQSYVWYLRDQGYTCEGVHPFNNWFYNRANVNRYLGFENYYFREDGFPETVKGAPAEDDLLYDKLWELFESSDPDTPYFNFAVTYEGHGPYNYRKNGYDTRFVLADETTADGYAMNNYLSCVYKRDQELAVLVERLRQTDRPVALVLFGDHKPTLGADVNNYTTAAYATFGMELNQGTEAGVINYYSTEYLIWLNPAAKQALGVDPAGRTGPMISPCYLMNQVFQVLDLGPGPSFLQAMGAEMEKMPVFANAGWFSVDGRVANVLTEEARTTRQEIRWLNYYRRTEKPE